MRQRHLYAIAVCAILAGTLQGKKHPLPSGSSSKPSLSSGAPLQSKDIPPLLQSIAGNGIFSVQEKAYYFLTPLPSTPEVPHRYELHRLRLEPVKLESLFRFDSRTPVQYLLFSDLEEKGFVFLSFDTPALFPMGPAHFVAFSLEKPDVRLQGEGIFTLVATENSAQLFEYQKQDFLELDITAQQSRRVSIAIPSTEIPIATTAQSLTIWAFRVDPKEKTHHMVLYNGTRLIENEFALEPGTQLVYNGGKIALVFENPTTHQRNIREKPKGAGKRRLILDYPLPNEKSKEKRVFSLPFHAVLRYGASDRRVEVLQYEQNQVLDTYATAVGEQVESVQVSAAGDYYAMTRVQGTKRTLSLFSFVTGKWAHIKVP